MEELRGLAAEVRKAVSDKGGKVIYEYNEFYGDPEPGPPVNEAGLSEPLINMLRARGIERLYRFQWEAVSLVNKGEDVVVISGTGTGKTEAFMIPVLERALRSRGEVVALLVYPTKALARDQARRLSSMMSGVGVPFAILDGDTPRDERRRIYENPPPILITNPDMLHVGLALSKDYRELWGHRPAGLR